MEVREPPLSGTHQRESERERESERGKEGERERKRERERERERESKREREREREGESEKAVQEPLRHWGGEVLGSRAGGRLARVRTDR